MTFAEKVARGMARSMAKNDAKHKAGQTLPKGVDVEEYAYIYDGDNMHKLNVYRPSNIKNTLLIQIFLVDSTDIILSKNTHDHSLVF